MVKTPSVSPCRRPPSPHRWNLLLPGRESEFWGSTVSRQGEPTKSERLIWYVYSNLPSTVRGISRVHSQCQLQSYTFTEQSMGGEHCFHWVLSYNCIGWVNHDPLCWSTRRPPSGCQQGIILCSAVSNPINSDMRRHVAWAIFKHWCFYSPLICECVAGSVPSRVLENILACRGRHQCVCVCANSECGAHGGFMREYKYSTHTLHI